MSGSNLARRYWVEKGRQTLITIISAKGSFILPGVQEKTQKLPSPLLSLSSHLALLTNPNTSTFHLLLI